jgi:hypothetical protein
MKAARAKLKSRLVPKVVFRTAFAGVVPLCVGTACGGAVTVAAINEGDAGGDASADGTMTPINGGVGCAAFCGVALAAFDGGPYGVADVSFGYPPGNGGEVAADAFGGDGVAANSFGGEDVADAGFGRGGFEAGVADATFGNTGDATKLDGSESG